MSLVPAEWNVVVLGRWNPALFTPAQISKRMFRLEEGTPVEVYLAIDEVAPPRIKHGGLLVSTNQTHLIIEPEQRRYESLRLACNMAAETVEVLSHTPLQAAGINVRYRGEDLPESVNALFSTELTNNFADAGFALQGRGFQRYISVNNAILSVSASSMSGKPAELLFNYESRSTSSDALAAWLRNDVATLRATIATVMLDVLNLGETDYVEQD